MNYLTIFLAVLLGSFNPQLDGDYVFRPHTGFGISAGYTLTVDDIRLNPGVEYTGAYKPSTWSSDLLTGPRQAHRAALGLSYGPFALNLSQEFGSSLKESLSGSLGFHADTYTLDVQYTGFAAMPRADSPFTLWYPFGSGSQGAPVSSSARIRSLAVNGEYAFSRQFTLLSVYDGRSVQRRSHGSWLVAAGYRRGWEVLDAEDTQLIYVMRRFGRFATDQVSLGGGYAFNWVLFHRDAESPADLQGLRNLTFNITAIPLLTCYNGALSQQYKERYDWGFEPGPYTEEIAKSYRSCGRIQPNFTVRTGLVYHVGRFFVNACASYSRFALSGKQVRIESSGQGAAFFSLNKTAADWTVSLRLNYLF